MAFGMAAAPDTTTDDLDAAFTSMPLPQGFHSGAVFDPAGVVENRLHTIEDLEPIRNAADQPDDLGSYRSFGLVPSYALSSVSRTAMSADDANAQYGIPGALRFNGPTSQEDAAFRHAQTLKQQYDAAVFALTKPQPLTDLGLSLAGGLADPIGWPLAAVGGPLADAAVSAWGLKAGAEAAAAAETASKISFLANAGRTAARIGVEGALVNAPYVGVDAALSLNAGDDYGMGDALRNIAVGTIFHGVNTALGVGLGSAAAALDRRAGRPTAPSDVDPEDLARETTKPASGPPAGVADLPAEARMGAFVKAVDDFANDDPVDVGRLVDRELNPPTLDRLDEATAAPAIDSWRPLDDAVAVSPRGQDFNVRYGLAELADLTTSHDDDLQVNPAYPQELQPRDRARAGAQAFNHQLEAELNPKLLFSDVSAAGGAPVVSPDGTVESGNGRTIALRRSAATGTEAYKRYRAELEAQGFDTSGMNQPVLVRMRTDPMTGAERAALAFDNNSRQAEGLSATEQAMADGRRLDTALADFPELTTLRDPAFTRAFIDRVAPGQQNLFVGKDGRLSPEGEGRIRAAALARAYGDPRLVAQVFEGEESPARQLGEALADAAPAWARMRVLARDGQIPAELDLTDALTQAMDLVRFARSEGAPLAQLIEERLGQKELFGGEAISPATEAFLRMAFQDERFTKPTAKAKLTAALRDYAAQAMEVTPGLDLFGESAGDNTARQILAGVAQKFASGDAGDIDGRAPGIAPGVREPPAPPRIDLGPSGGQRERPGGGVPSEDGGGAAGEALARITGEEIAPPGTPLKDFRAAVKAWFTKNLAPRKVASAALDGREVSFNRVGRDKASVARKGEAQFQLFAALPELIAEGRLVKSEAPRDQAIERTTKAYHTLEGKVAIGDKLVDARVIIREGPAGDFHYDHSVVRGETATPAPASDPMNSGGGTPGRGPDQTVSPEAETRKARQTGEQIIAADHELKALAEDSARLAAENGLTVETADKDKPDTLAEAVRAAAICLAEEG